MNWGWKLAILYGTFIVGILVLVIKSGQRSVELVRPDYYQQELIYGKRMNAIAAAAALSGPVEAKVSGAQVEVSFPEECIKTKIEGKIKLYRPDDSKADQEFVIALDTAGRQLITPVSPKPGYYVLQSSWTMNSKEHYNEQSIYMQP